MFSYGCVLHIHAPLFALLDLTLSSIPSENRLSIDRELLRSCIQVVLSMPSHHTKFELSPAALSGALVIFSK